MEWHRVCWSKWCFNNGYFDRIVTLVEKPDGNQTPALSALTSCDHKPSIHDQVSSDQWIISLEENHWDEGLKTWNSLQFIKFLTKRKSLSSSFKIHLYSEQILKFWVFNKQEREFNFYIPQQLKPGTKGKEQKSPFFEAGTSASTVGTKQTNIWNWITIMQASIVLTGWEMSSFDSVLLSRVLMEPLSCKIAGLHCWGLCIRYVCESNKIHPNNHNTNSSVRCEAEPGSR